MNMFVNLSNQFSSTKNSPSNSRRFLSLLDDRRFSIDSDEPWGNTGSRPLHVRHRRTASAGGIEDILRELPSSGGVDSLLSPVPRDEPPSRNSLRLDSDDPVTAFAAAGSTPSRSLMRGSSETRARADKGAGKIFYQSIYLRL